MGITGLIPLLREAQRSGHVKEFSGQTVGVDSYIWLYKGAFSCASDLALNLPTTKYISFFLSRARMLRHHGIDPLFVFDGGPLPSKLHTELERQRNRSERRQTAVKLWNQSKRKQAYEQFQRCVEVTPMMAKMVIDELRKEGFRCLVAPYEADAQLAYLESQGLITAAISEDSDLIVFGCRNIIFKLDQYGEAVIFDRQKMMDAKAVGIKGWTNEQVRRMCILSGCDYLPSVPGVGLKKAHRYVSRSQDLRAAIQLMRGDKLLVPEEYETEVERAELTFKYQRVYDPRAKCLAFVTPLDDTAPSVEDMPFIGVQLEPHVAHGIAMAELDPFTYLPFTIQAAVEQPPPPPVAKSVPVVRGKAAAPVTRARSLQSFWGTPKPAQTRRVPATTAAEQMPDAGCVVVVVVPPVVPAENNEVNVKFRGNDQHSKLVSTTQKSRFFAKPPPPVAVDTDTTDLSTVSTQVPATVDTPLPSTPLPVSQCETVVDDFNLESSMLSQPRLLKSGTAGLQRRPLISSVADDTRAISLFGQFTNRGAEDTPEYAKRPTYNKTAVRSGGLMTRGKGRGATESPSSVTALSPGPRTPITQVLRRISTDRLALQPLDDNIRPPLYLLDSSPPSAKRRQNAQGSLIEEAKKFRYHAASAPSLALLVDDDIVDSSGSDTENRAITI
ncbi:hypothetical protein GGI17_000865 [Coemansia sp. S146]|nr:hypothetical protein GGI17_000865 [Coemansia sp. S146]